ncbi:hypothetical protein LX32DRAFT_196862 [Colletotrichum zoysiae]|uniref:Uncharacterized protein n=1 Tax=Colletotrichum zoysiae TaxID=1216348 RepID=A0AAD9HQJ3_9PEZI|nr:hypothetical protein LX32DRAFT_196862 [Colletotrichum zoysiae]
MGKHACPVRYRAAGSFSLQTAAYDQCGKLYIYAGNRWHIHHLRLIWTYITGARGITDRDDLVFIVSAFSCPRHEQAKLSFGYLLLGSSDEGHFISSLLDWFASHLYPFMHALLFSFFFNIYIGRIRGGICGEDSMRNGNISHDTKGMR